MTSQRKNPSVVIIGAGMTGILLVIKLRELGITNITLLEKAETLGGTWRENTYPGIACDVPAHAYTYSFEPNPDWSHHFAPGPEIYQYFHKVFYKYGVNFSTHFNEAATSCVFNDDSQTWTVSTSQNKTYEADLLFSATGLLHQPNIPKITGLESFAGPSFHSARWDHSVSRKGKRIGIIGTGSSATQIISELVLGEGVEVTVFQRTPQWIVAVKDEGFTEAEKQRFRRQPFRIKLIRNLSLFIFGAGTNALTGDKLGNRILHRLMSWNAGRYLNSTVKDPVLRAKLTPNYKMGCKRVVINDRFYDAIQQPGTRLVTESIDQIEPQGVRTKDGQLHEVDILVLATGFDPKAYMRPMTFVGKNGLSIEDAWSKKLSAYQSMFLPGFPNYILMLGPNSPIGNQSVIEISEHQTAYALQLVRRWQAGELATIEAKPEALARWAAMIKSRMSHTVWTSGCQSWYLDADGDALAWPDTWKNWVKIMEQPILSDFDSTPDHNEKGPRD